MSYDDFYREAFETDGEFAEYFPDESICVEIGGQTFWVKDDEYADGRIRELEEQYAPQTQASIPQYVDPENRKKLDKLRKMYNEIVTLQQNLDLSFEMSVILDTSKQRAEIRKKKKVLSFSTAECPPIVNPNNHKIRAFQEAICPPIY